MTDVFVNKFQLRQMEENGEITVSWVEGKNQLADCMTKAGASTEKLFDVLEDSILSSVKD